MTDKHKAIIPRRDVLRAMTIGVAAAAATAAPLTPAAAAPETESKSDKRKSRYSANSAEVKSFYRVNSYPAK